eukprot:scaffold56542_cov66-Phaeocystis_antarctica.AAC.2
MGTPSCPTPTNKLNSLNSACNSAAAASAAAAAKAAAAASVAAAAADAVAQSSAAASSNLVRVGALPPHLNDEQVRELVSAFGVLKHFSLPKVLANPAHSLGYALIEYEATEITDVAVSALNSLEICGKALEVKREPASVSAPPAASPTPAAEPKPEPATLYTVELRGVATEEHLADEKEYKAILAEVEQECGELGDVYRVLLERPPASVDERALAELTGKVFGSALVSFGERSDAQRCKQALDGRKYDGRVVEAVPQWDEEAA